MIDPALAPVDFFVPGSFDLVGWICHKILYQFGQMTEAVATFVKNISET